MPTVTFSEAMTLHLGEPVEVQLFGGHCPGASVIYLPERKLLLTGDLIFNGRMPYMGVADFTTWIQALRTLETWDVLQVIPGHGPVGGKDLLTQQRQWLEGFVGRVKAWEHAGVSKEQKFKTLLEELSPPERWFSMIERAIELALL